MTTSATVYTFLFIHIGGQRDADSSTVDWATTLSLFGLFGLASALFWAYWRNRDRTAAAPVDESLDLPSPR